MQQQATSPQSLVGGDGGGDRRSSEFVTHDQLKIELLKADLHRVKEENSALKSENKLMQQQLQQQSPAVTPLVPSSAYINRTRGSAGTPAPFNHAFAGQPGSGMRFSPPGNAFAQRSPPRNGSGLDASSAAASSSCFRGVPLPEQQPAPASVGSTRHSPQGPVGATPPSAPGSSTGSATRRAVEPLPMQPLEPAGRPSPVQQQQQSPTQPAAKALAEAINKARDKQAQVSWCAV
jgi:hypothetical protein